MVAIALFGKPIAELYGSYRMTQCYLPSHTGERALH